MNGNGFREAIGRTAWFATIVLNPGTNTFSVKAVDDAGNESPLLTRTFFYGVPTLITLITNQPNMGMITGNFSDSTPDLTHGYMVTATAKPGFVFSNWTGTAASYSNVLNFIMQNGETLSANFVPNPYVAVAGVYNGLFQSNSDPNQVTCGYFTFKPTTNGTYTGKIMVNGGSYLLNGSFDVFGNSTVMVPRLHDTTLTVALSINLAAQDNTMGGYVTDGNWISTIIYAGRVIFDANTNPATNFVGKYTVQIPGDADPSNSLGGSGYATLTIATDGTVTMIGKLADGTSISQSVPINKDGAWLLYVPLYNGKGSIFGPVTFGNQPNTSMNGTLFWSKPALASSKFYPAAFALSKTLYGSYFRTPASNSTPLLAFPFEPTGNLSISGGNLSSSIYAPITNGVTLKVASTNHISFSLDRNSGLITGSFIHPVTHVSTPLNGVVLQVYNVATGYFLGTNQSGNFSFP